MKKRAKQVLAAVCALVLVLGSGLAIIGQASDTNADVQNEWIMYSGEKESIITDEGHLVVSVEDAGVDIPDTVKKSDLKLRVTLSIPNENALTSIQKGVLEIAQDICDEAELSWELSTHSLTIGENVLELALSDGMNTGATRVLDVHQTINWFRIYSLTNPNGSTVALKEVKLIDTRTAGLLFGGEKTSDTYLQLSDALNKTPQTIEASVKMEPGEGDTTEWMLHSGNTFSGVSMPVGSYTTTSSDAPGEGMTCFTLDASNSSISGFEALQTNLNVNAGTYTMEDLALSFWVYSNKEGTLGEDWNPHIRISSNPDNVSSNFVFYYMKDIAVNTGWNHIEIPLTSMKTDVIGDFTVSNIDTWGITSYSVSQGTIRYFGDFKIVVTNENEEVEDTPVEEEKPTEKFTGWMLHSGSRFSGVSMSVGSYTTTPNDAPGAGMECFVLNASNSAINGFEALQHSLGINASAYTMDELAVGFWVYSNKAGTLSPDWDGQIRLSSNKDNMSGNCLFYYMREINVEQGWNYIQLPLSSMKKDIIGSFTLSDINTWGIAAGYKVPQGTIRYFGDIKLVPLVEKEEGVWTLHKGTKFSGVSMPVGSYVTTADDAPGEGMTCFKLDATNNAINGFEAMQTQLKINASKYDMDELSIAFWVYSNKAGTLGADWNTHIRLGSNADNMSGNCLFYYLYEVPVQAGWNYIKLPLSSLKTDIKGNFSISNINTVGITSYNVPKGTVRYFGDIKLVAEQPEPITSVVLRSGSDVTTTSGHTVSTGTTLAGDRIGANKTYNILSDGSTAVSGFSTMNNKLGINASASELGDLAVAFWVYSNEAGKLGTGDQFRIGSGPYLGGNALIYYYSDIEVNEGWNYIELPLDTWKTDIQQDFTLKNIDVFGFTNYNLAEGQIRYITDIQLINKKLVSVEMPEVYVDVTKQVTTLDGNYMIFSNVNAGNESNTYGLFITNEGYPSLLYGTTKFTLTQDIRTGEWVDIAVTRDTQGFVSFYINGEIVARSDVAVPEMGAPSTEYCIGSDGTGKQIMKGYLSDIRVWSDVRTAEEIEDNRVAKEVGVFSNGINANAEGLMGNWFLLGDIQNVLETLPDSSSNQNELVYRGSRADDWIDYEIPDVIGDNYWSIVFVPDIQKLTFQSDYNKTWNVMAEWIAEHIEAENIQHVIGAGDTTDGNVIQHYDRAMEGFNKFDDLVPTSIIIGNHDYIWGTTSRDSTMYQSYFGEDDLLASAAATTYVGYFDDPAGLSTTENSYYRFSVNGTKWMILQLEYHPRVSTLEWAQDILEAHPDDNVIFATHSYLDGYGNYANNTNMSYIVEDANVGGSIGDTTEAIWSEYLNEYTNIKMIVCGHSHNETGAVMTRTEINADGSEVPVLMINAQDMDYDAGVNIQSAYYDYKPIGMLGILRFSADGSKVALQYYAPTSEKSFSPEDPFGHADSNNLVYTLDVAMCSHTGTTVKVNADAATGITDGYTGDEYCTDCETMVSVGTVIPATGDKQETLDDIQQDNQQDTGNDTQKDTEQSNTQIDTDKTDSPQTGDAANLIIWFALVGAAVVSVYGVRNQFRKEEK